MAEFGHFSLTLAGVMAFVTAILGYGRSDDEHWAAHIGSLVLGTFVFASISFVALVWFRSLVRFV